MVNLLRYRARAEYAEQTDLPPCSGREAYFSRYVPAFASVAEKVAPGEHFKPFYLGTVQARRAIVGGAPRMNDQPSREPSRTAIASRTCLVCGAALSPSQQRYCTRACQQQAYRLRHHQPSRLDFARLRAELKRRRQLAEHTVYECPSCETRSVGEQRCADCNTFGRALGLGGQCPDCDAVLLLNDLLEMEGAPPLLTRE